MRTKHEIVAYEFVKHFEPLSANDVVKHDRLRPAMIYCVWSAYGRPNIKKFSNMFANRWGVSKKSVNDGITYYLSHERDHYLKGLTESVVRYCKDL